MTDEIKPALTADEWASYPNWPNATATGDLPLYYPSKHGIAAANLHGEPFGFIPEDVEALRAVSLDYCPEEWTAKERQHLNRIRRLASRIAALLPPEDEGSLDAYGEDDASQPGHPAG